MSGWRRPFWHLLLASGLLFVTYGVAIQRSNRTIRFSAEDVQLAVEAHELVTGGPLSPEERQQLLDQIVEDELLIREAFRLGIDRGDTQVRNALVSATQRALLPAGNAVVEPSFAELTAYFERNRERYRIPEALTFEQVFLPFGAVDRDGEDELLETLRSGTDPVTAIVDIGLASYSIQRQLSRRALSRGGGQDFADQLFAAAHDQWTAPISARQGVVMALVHERHPSEDRVYADVERYLKEDWFRDKQNAEIAPELASLRRRYAVRLEGEEP